MSRRALIGLALAGAAGLSLGTAAIVRMPPIDLARSELTSPLVLADDGRILRAYTAADTRWRFATSVTDVPRDYLDFLLAYEDRRFYEHHGVDIRSVARAGWQLLRTGRRVSGGSTLTMQVARLLEPGSRGVIGKIKQIIRALELERHYSKRQILSLYLTLAPFGSNIEGVRAASLIYFGKEPQNLEPAESALLVAISQQPERRRPDRFLSAALAARTHVIQRAVDLGAVSAETAAAARGDVAVSRRPPALLAAHLADKLRRERDASLIYTTVDFELQRELERLARENVAPWPREMNAAVLVVRNSDCAVRAYVGGVDYFAKDNSGQYDHVRAIRSPGSTLKPMIYGLAFEDLIVHPYTQVTDEPIAFKGYAPKNFNENFQGEMTVRDALIKSINTTAVVVLSKVGPSRILTRLRSAGVPVKVVGTDLSAGLAIGLGGVGTSLENLTRIYSGIARRGPVCTLDFGAEKAKAVAADLLAPDASWALADILADSPPPDRFSVRHARDGGRRIAYKTGTSFGFRDAWAIGFDDNYTVGVWTGRTDGEPTLGATGVGVAAPLLYRVFDRLPDAGHDVAAERPTDSVLARRDDLPARLLRLGGDSVSRETEKVSILFPREDSTIAPAMRSGAPEPFSFIAKGGTPPYFWNVDGRPLDATGPRARWQPNGAGQVSVTVMDSTGAQSKVNFWVR